MILHCTLLYYIYAHTYIHTHTHPYICKILLYALPRYPSSVLQDLELRAVSSAAISALKILPSEARLFDRLGPEDRSHDCLVTGSS